MRRFPFFLGLLAALLMYLVATAGPAYATFPGANGRISFTRESAVQEVRLAEDGRLRGPHCIISLQRCVKSPIRRCQGNRG